MSEISYNSLTLMVPVIRGNNIEYKKLITVTNVSYISIFSTISNISAWQSFIVNSDEITENDLDTYSKAGYSIYDTLIDSTTSSFAENLYEDSGNGVPYDYTNLVEAVNNSSIEVPCTVYLDKFKLQTYLDSLVQINDQKLIDIVYVDDEGNKHKYSGPFINDLTITSEIQEKLTTLDTLNTQIGELKTKLETLGTTVASTGSKIKFTTDLTQYEDDSSIITIMTPTNIPILDILQNGVSIGWVDFTRFLKLVDTAFYFGLPANVLPEECALNLVGDWSNIQNYTPTGLDDIADIHINTSTVYTNGNTTGSIAFPSSSPEDNVITIVDSDGSVWFKHFYLGFKPEE